MPYPSIVQNLVPRKRFIGNFQGITPNLGPMQTVTLDVNGSWNHLEWLFNLVGITAAMIQEMRVKIGGTVIQKWVGADLDARLQYDKVPAVSVNSVLTVPFRRLALRGGETIINWASKVFIPGDPRFLAYESSLNVGSAGGGQAAITNVSVEFDLINTPNSACAIQMYSRVTAPVDGGPGLVLRIDKQTKTFANGSVSFTKAEMGLDADRKFLSRVYFTLPGGLAISNVQVRYGTNDWWVVPDNVLTQAQQMDGLHNVPSGLFILDFQEEGWGDTLLDMSDSASDFAIFLTASGLGGATAVPYYMETLGIPQAAAA